MSTCHRLLLVGPLVLYLSSVSLAQLPPFAPIAPKSTEECQAFSRDVEGFFAMISQKHEACLAANKPDNNEKPGSTVCSRSSCQSLHDQLYGSLGMTLKTKREDVSKCYAQVNDFLNRQAKEKQEELDRKQKEAARAEQDGRRREEERQKQLADKERAAAADRNTQLKAQAEQAKRQRENQERIAAAARYAEELQRAKAQEAAERKALADQIARHHSQPSNSPNSSRSAEQRDPNGRQVLQEMSSDPFGTKRDGKTYTGSGADVRSITAGTNPFASSGDKKQQDPKKEAPTMAEVSHSITEYIQSTGDAWKSLQGEVHLTEPFKLAIDALNMADTASRGEVPTTLPIVEKLADYANKEGTVLDTLAHRSTEDWLKDSGLNSFDRSTVPAAQNYLDNLSKRLSTIQRLNQQFLPSITAAQRLLENPAVNAARMATAQSTLPGLDPIALQDVIARLNGCSSQIEAIQNKLRLARSVVY